MRRTSRPCWSESAFRLESRTKTGEPPGCAAGQDAHRALGIVEWDGYAMTIARFPETGANSPPVRRGQGVSRDRRGGDPRQGFRGRWRRRHPISKFATPALTHRARNFFQLLSRVGMAATLALTLAGCTTSGTPISLCRVEPLPAPGVRLAHWSRAEFLLVVVRDVGADLTYAGRTSDGLLTFEVWQDSRAATFNAGGRALPVGVSRSVTRHNVAAVPGTVLEAATLGGPYSLTVREPGPDGSPSVAISSSEGCRQVAPAVVDPSTASSGARTGDNERLAPSPSQRRPPSAVALSLGGRGEPGQTPSCSAIRTRRPEVLIALARARASGDGGWEQNRVRAYGWFLIAMQNGYWPQPYERELLRAGLSERDLRAAEVAAEAWRGTCDIEAD